MNTSGQRELRRSSRSGFCSGHAGHGVSAAARGGCTGATECPRPADSAGSAGAGHGSRRRNGPQQDGPRQNGRRAWPDGIWNEARWFGADERFNRDYRGQPADELEHGTVHELQVTTSDGPCAGSSGGNIPCCQIVPKGADFVAQSRLRQVRTIER